MNFVLLNYIEFMLTTMIFCHGKILTRGIRYRPRRQFSITAVKPYHTKTKGTIITYHVQITTGNTICYHTK